MLTFTGLRGFLIGVLSTTWFGSFGVGVSSVYERIKEESVGSGSQEQEEEAMGSDREVCQSGRGRKCRRDPDADGEGPTVLIQLWNCHYCQIKITGRIQQQVDSQDPVQIVFSEERLKRRWIDSFQNVPEE